MAACAWAVGCLLVLTGAGTHDANAQDDAAPVTLVTNVGQTTTAFIPMTGTWVRLAQQFTTGTAAGGYSIDSISLDLNQTNCSARAQGFDVIVEIVEGVSNTGTPSTVPGNAAEDVLHRWTMTSTPNEALTLPTTYDVDGTDGTVYSTPKGAGMTTLSPSTTYFVLMRLANTQGGEGYNCADWNVVSTANVDGTNSDGWSVSDAQRYQANEYLSWADTTFRITVSGNEASSGPTVDVSSPESVNEGNSGTSTVTFTVEPSEAPDSSETVQYAITSTGTVGTDYTVANATGTLTFTSATAQNIDVTVNGDTTFEEDETITLTLSSPSAGLGLGTASSTTTITNDDMAPIITISSPTVDEGDSGDSTTLSYVLTKTGATDLSAEVTYAIDSSSTATVTDDYTHTVASPIAFTATETSKTITIDVVEDNVAEADETVIVRLSSPMSARFSTGTTLDGTGTIANDDLLELSITDAMVAEGDTGTATLTFMVTLDAVPPADVTVQYAVEDGTANAPADYVDPSDGTLTFRPADASFTQSIEVTVNGDTMSEGNETLTVTLSSPACSGCPAGVTPTLKTGGNVGTGTITDDDLPSLSVNSPTLAAEGDSGTATVTFMVSPNAAPAADSSVRYEITSTGTATVNTDFTVPAITGTLEFDANSTTPQPVVVTVIGDEIHENDETVIIQLSMASPSTAVVLGTSMGTATITDDDDEPVIAISDPTVDEGDSGDTAVLTYVLTKTGATALDASVAYAIAGTSTATGSGNGKDYTHTVASPIAFTATETSKTITINVDEDNLAEADETVIVTLSSPMGATLMGGVSTLDGTGTITNDDLLELSISDEMVTEGDDSDTDTMTFTVTLDAVPPAEVMVTYTVADGTATASADYTVASATGMVTFAANTSQLTQTIPAITINGDTDIEGSETLTVTLSNPTCASCPAGVTPTLKTDEDVGTGTIVDNEIPSVSIDSPSVAEGDSGTKTLTFMVRPSGMPAADATVRYEITTMGTATVGTDFTATATEGTLSFMAGATTVRPIEITLNGDGIYEADETVIVELSMPAPSSELALGTSTGTATITNDDDEPVISISDPAVDEGDSGDSAVLTYVLTKTGATEVDASVAYAITGTATGSGNGKDYTHTVASPFTFTAAEASKTITINVDEDNLAEADETVIITLSSPMDAAFAGGVATIDGTGTIRDDDLLELSISDEMVTERDTGDTDPMTFTVTLDAIPPADVTVTYTVADDTATATNDYTVASATGTITFAANTSQLTQTIPAITINGDTDIEGSEALTVTLSNPTCASCPAGVTPTLKTDEDVGTGTIIDNEIPSVSIDSPSVAEGDSGTKTLMFMVRPSGSPAAAATVRYEITDIGTATAGTDFTAAATTGTLNFAAGATAAQPIEVTVNGDGTYEENETVIVELSMPTPSSEIALGISTGTGTITNDDDAPVISISSPSVDEGDSGDTTVLTYMLTKTGATEVDASVAYAIAGSSTATGSGSGKDYTHTLASPIAFTASETSKEITIEVDEDSLAETDETVIVTLSSPMGATLMGGGVTLDGTGTIRNDDLLDLSISDERVTEGDTGDTATMTFTVTLGAETPADVTVDYTIEDGTATAPDDYVDVPDGMLTFTAGGPLTQTIPPITVNGDTLTEGIETLTVTLSSPTCAACPTGVTPTLKSDETIGTGTIIDNDAPTFTVSVDDVTERDSGTSVMTFTVTMTTAWNQAVTVDYEFAAGTAAGEATVGQDFRASSGTLTFAPAAGGNPGETEKTVEVTIIGDRTIEPDETVTLTLSNATGGAQISQTDWTGTILSDDYALTVAAAPASVPEPASGTAEIAFMVTLAADPGRQVELDYALSGGATEGADYTVAAATAMADRGTTEAGKLAFASGATTRTVRLLVNPDIVNEAAETVAVEVFSAGGTSLGEAEATIAPPESSTPGVAAVPDAVITVDPVRTQEEEGVTTAVFQVEVESASRDFSVEVHWKVTQLVETTSSASALARSTGGVAPRASRVERVLADSRRAPNRPLTLAATESEAELAAILDESVSPGASLGFEITGLAGGCSTRTCTVRQGDEVTPERQLALSQGSTPSTAAVAAVFQPRRFADQAASLQKHALAGFGRTMAAGIVGGIWQRANLHRSGDDASTARIGGRSIDTAAMSSGDGSRVARETARLFGVEAVQPPPAMAGDGFTKSASGDWAAWRSRTIIRDSESLLERSRFSLIFGDGFDTGSLAVWGSGSTSSFESSPEEGAFVDGSTRTMLAGVDWRSGEYLAGVALSRVSGNSDYDTENAGQSAKGSLETSLTGVAPYIHWLGATGLGVWGSFGTGSGTMELASSGGALETDVGVTMLALGVKGASKQMGEVEYAMRGDFFRTTMTAEQTTGFGELAAEASRIRVALEGGSTRKLGSGGSMSNRIELGARMDSGDGEEGAGADLAVELRYGSADGGLEMAGRASALLLHQQDGFREWGAGLDVAYAPGQGGRGLRLSLEPRWNVPWTGAADSLWSGAAPGTNVDAGGDVEAGASLRTRLGYGVGTFGDLVLASPYSEMETGDGERRVQLGVELRGTTASLERLRVNLYGQRDETGEDVERRTMLEARLGL